MICYRDRTFCPFWKDCKNGKKCGRAMTKEIISYVKEMNLSICQFMEKPECYKDINNV